MKRFNFLPVAIALLLMVTAVSCTTMAGSQDDYYGGPNRSYGNRVYVEDPYRGTVVLERDPRTGRYYEVDPYYNNGYYGGYYGNTRYGSRVYGYPNTTRSPNYGRTNNGGYRNNGTGSTQNTQKPTEDDRKTREEARKKILGN